MKYMTFNSSCSFAGMANMLERQGIHAEDREIALEMKLPFLVDKFEGNYHTGPMLQQKKWFDIYLNKLGLEIVEEWIDRKQVFSHLQTKETAMLGVNILNGRHHKHAVVYIGTENGKARFINNKHFGSDEPEEFLFSQEELEELLVEKVVVSFLKPCAQKDTDMKPLLKQSIAYLDDLYAETVAFCLEPHTNEEILANEQVLFRPLLLDGATMMQLIENDGLYKDIRVLQKVFVQVALKDKKDGIVFADLMDMDLLSSVVDRWKELITKEIEKC